MVFRAILLRSHNNDERCGGSEAQSIFIAFDLLYLNRKQKKTLADSTIEAGPANSVQHHTAKMSGYNSLSVLPRNLRPMRLSRRSEPFDSDQFFYELKIDARLRLSHAIPSARPS